MAAICNGIAYHGGLRPFCATFLVFSDYMRGAMRVAAIAKLPVIHILTHDSVFVGEDGPTHEPGAPGGAARDAEPSPPPPGGRRGDRAGMEDRHREARWSHGARADPPGHRRLPESRSAVENVDQAGCLRREGLRRNARCRDRCDRVGGLRCAAGCRGPDGPEGQGRVDALPRTLRCSAHGLPEDSRSARREKKVVFEAGVSFGWKGIADDSTLVVGIDRFGESGAYQKIAEHLGITAASLEKRIRAGK